MIIINKHDYKNCKAFLDNYYLGRIEYDKDIIFIVEEDNKKLGYIIVTKNNKIASIKDLFVLENYRNMNFGDGLIRTALNSLRLDNINKVFYKNNCDYLLRKGFIKNDDNLECIIEDFFSKHNCKRR
ncbi:GNAT family N-acetyltransferase [Clostridium sp. D2Q-11]|uniref:GNAT family N-acetyltransferase n=1 Tax=Anaeromonas frigoriresistens TaxID=2683708 RepID=A0A942UVE6_9FIRM|nr:GNAT family N-acetyltransferase [Anaeromonas frigoriresistens]MBS4539954.1 GNAT family N-acetyltransferase [Anaeromonas frigoriresistens]